MGEQFFDGMWVDPEDVMEALWYRYSLHRRSGYSESWRLRALREAYHEYHSRGDSRVNRAFQKQHWRMYLETGEVPFYAMRIGCELIKRAHEHAFQERFVRKHYGGGRAVEPPKRALRVVAAAE